MKAQFFIISSVIMIYIIVLTFQYLAGFSDIRLSGTEEFQELSYIKNIKNSFIQTVNTSNYANNGDINKIVKDVNFTQNFFKQELLKKGIDFDSDFIIFSNGFETGLSAWSVNGTPTLVNGLAQDGAWSLYSSGTEYVTEYLPGMNEVYAKVYVNFNTLPSNGNTYYFMEFYDHGNGITKLGLWNNNGDYELRACFQAGNCWGSPGIDINQNEWHYFELYWLENGTNSKIMAWYDGDLTVDNETINSGGIGKSINEYRFGGVEVGGGGSPDLYTDCIAISSFYTGGNCYPDSQYYFYFSLKTNSMKTTTGFSYEQPIQGYAPTSSFCGDAVMCLKFDEGLGTKAYDSSPYGNNGTLTNRTNGTITWTTGVFGNALKFQANTSAVGGPYVSLPFSSSLNVSQPVTITAWINLTSFPGWIMSRNTANGATILYVSGGQLNVHWGNYTEASYVILTGGAISLSKWYFVAFTYDSTGNAIIYVNGSSVASTSKNATRYTDVLNQPWYTGYYWNGAQNFNGTIDEVRVWNRALSVGEIQSEMSKG